MAPFKIALLGAALTMIGYVPPALARTAQEEAAFREACTADYMAFCAMHDPDSPAVESCFKAKMKELSPECRAAIAASAKKNPGKRSP
jgi:hypothetical protein